MSNNILEKINIKLFMFIIALEVCVISSIVRLTFLTNVIPGKLLEGLFFVSGIVLLLKIILFDNLTLRQWFIYVILLLLAGISYYYSQRYEILVLITLMISVQDIPSKLIVKSVFYTTSIIIFIIFIFSLVNIIPNDIYSRADSGVIRYAFGTTYPTVFGSFCFFLILQYTYLKRNYSYLSIFFIFLVSIFILKYTDNRLASVLVLVWSIIMIFYKKSSESSLAISNVKSYILSFSVTLMPIFFLLISYDYKKSNYIYRFINDLLSGRLYLSWEGLTNYPVKLFGQNILMNGFGNKQELSYGIEYFYLDSLPIYVILTFGISMYLMYLAYTYFMVNKSMKFDKILTTILIIIVLYDLVDNKSLYVCCNPFILLFFNMNGVDKNEFS